jgi:hypothetical protein
VIDDKQLAVLRLIAKRSRKSADGWADFTRIEWQAIQVLPADLVERRNRHLGGGLARLTDAGQRIAAVIK